MSMYYPMLVYLYLVFDLLANPESRSSQELYSPPLRPRAVT